VYSRDKNLDKTLDTKSGVGKTLPIWCEIVLEIRS
jgi:hypothetical protein